MHNYRENVRLFRSSARYYLNNKMMIASAYTDKCERFNDLALQYLYDDLLYVENVLDRIYEKCGSAARLIIYLLYVENFTQETVAKDYNLTRRQLQYSLEKWMRAVFEEETD